MNSSHGISVLLFDKKLSIFTSRSWLQPGAFSLGGIPPDFLLLTASLDNPSKGAGE
jgi:hypothetical protein